MAILGTRGLNRALLARQMLLERSSIPVLDAVERLVGMQAQVPNDPYIGLWSRIEPFDPDDLGTCLSERKAVRATMMRATIHLVTTPDLCRLRPLVQPVVERAFHGQSAFAEAVAGMDIEETCTAVRALLADRPLTGREIRDAITARWPDRDTDAVWYLARFVLPLVQVPPRGLWGSTGVPTWGAAEDWTGKPLDSEPSIERMIVRYLAAFGPASPADFRRWSRLTGLREVFDRLRPELVTFRDEHNRELFDLPDAPRPGEDTPAPVRFLPTYDNVMLSHEDRGRIVDAAYLRRGVIGKPAFTVDGFVGGTWTLARGKKQTALDIQPLRPLSADERGEIEEEASALLAFGAPGSDHDVRFLD
jgi:hypothetical protein